MDWTRRLATAGSATSPSVGDAAACQEWISVQAGARGPLPMIQDTGIPLVQLSELGNAVCHLLQELPLLMRSSHAWEVQQCLTRCLWQTRVQAMRLEQVLVTLEATSDRSESTMLAALLSEARGILNRESSSPFREAAILFACQRAIRHELVLYREVLDSTSSLPGGVVAGLSRSLHERELSELQISELLKEIVIQMRGELPGAGVVPSVRNRMPAARCIGTSPAAAIPGSEGETGLDGSVA